MLRLLCVTLSVMGSSTAADLVLRDGKVITLDPSLPQASAIAVTNGRISAIGFRRSIFRRFGRETPRCAADLVANQRIRAKADQREYGCPEDQRFCTQPGGNLATTSAGRRRRRVLEFAVNRQRNRRKLLERIWSRVFEWIRDRRQRSVFCNDRFGCGGLSCDRRRRRSGV